jgi:hypothetical protein
LLEQQRYFRFKPVDAKQGEEEEIEFQSIISQGPIVLGLYFGSYNNPGSLKFTKETLTPFYFESNASKKQIELLYVNSDTTYKDFLKHMAIQKHWPTLPF